ncbi:MAG TPA: hypothetical protein VFH17_00255 [Coriobacteriia bacterium]|nr:hypothetical protein [Coriobacteriia bacterium]
MGRSGGLSVRAVLEYTQAGAKPHVHRGGPGGTYLVRAAQTRMRAVGEAAVLLLALGALLGVVARDFLSAYQLHGDDFAPVFHSAAPYFDIAHWYTWFTKGWSEYFLNYEGWPVIGSEFVRPVVNAGLHVAGYATPSLGDAAYLAGNYVALVAAVLLTNTFIRQCAEGVSFPVRAFVSLAVGVSPVWEYALYEASFATNAYALAFSLAALVALDPRRGVPGRLRFPLCVVFQILAVGSHETAIVIPLVCVSLLYALSPERPYVRRLWPLCLPVIYFALTRALVQSVGGVYALVPGSVESVLKRIAAVFVGPIVPFDVMRLSELVRAESVDAVALAYALAIVANIALLGVAVPAIRATPSRMHLAALIGAVVLARIPAALGRLDPRFLGLGFVVTVVVLLVLTQRSGLRRWQMPVVALVFASQFALLASNVYAQRSEVVDHMQRAGAYYSYVRQSVVETDPTTVVLVNDDVAYFSARAMLEMAAWPRQDVRFVVLNSMSGGPDREGSVAIRGPDGVLEVAVSLDGEQRVVFAGATPDFGVRANGFLYAGDAGDGTDVRAFTATGGIDDGSTLVVGVDPATGSFLPAAVY